MTIWWPRNTSSSRKGWRESSTSRDGHLDGLYAFLGVGRNISRFHGRSDAARLAQPCKSHGAIACCAKCSSTAIREDPDWKNGDYTTEPQPNLRFAADILLLAADELACRCRKALPTRDAVGQATCRCLAKTPRGGLRRQRFALRLQRLPQLRSSSQLKKIQASVMFVIPRTISSIH